LLVMLGAIYKREFQVEDMILHVYKVGSRIVYAISHVIVWVLR
jgi:hypothetical protein